MKKISVLAALILVLSLMLAGSAGAAIVEVPDPGPQYWDSSAQAIAAAARNGNPNDPNFTKADYGIAMGVTDLSTPANIYNAVIDQWTYGHRYYFTLEYVTTSTSYPFPTPKYTSFTVTKDANPPSSSNLFGAVADLFGDNLSFYTIRLNYFGNADPAGGGRVEISDLKLNGVAMGTGAYDSGNAGGISNNFVYFRNSDGSPFTNHFIITGDFVFTGYGGTNYPGFEFDLSAQPVPLPPAVLLLGTGLLGLAGLRRFRKG